LVCHRFVCKLLQRLVQDGLPNEESAVGSALVAAQAVAARARQHAVAGLPWPFSLSVPDVARYLAVAGRTIAIEPNAVEPVAAPLRALYILGTDDGGTVHPQRLTGGDRFAAVQECRYGPAFADEHRDQLALAAAVVEQAAVHRLWRPAQGWSVAQVADIILPHSDPPPTAP
jgi:hypothetical protein